MLRLALTRRLRMVLITNLVGTLVIFGGLGVTPGPTNAQSSSTRVDEAVDPYAPIDSARQMRGQASRRGADAAAGQVAQPDASTFRPTEIDTTPSDSSDRKRQARTGTVATDREENQGDDGGNRRTPPLPRKLAPPSEFENYVSQIVGRPLRRFGANLLAPEARDFVVPSTTSVPADYRLNPGDEVVVGLTGSIIANNARATVDPQGRIFIPRIGAINIAGVRYADLPGVIEAQVARQYRNFRVSVTVGRLHGITVYVTGFAAQPGSYTVSSLSTIVNAVLAAGGPSAGGSFRSIQLRREGRIVSDFDLYDLLLRGEKTGDVPLENGDVVYIAPVGAQVAVIGSVNNEAIYEAGAKDMVSDVLIAAGGVNTVADNSRALVLDPLRTEGFGWEELTPAQTKLRQVGRGLVVRVLSGVGIARSTATQPVLVTVSGEVSKPGRYYLAPNTRLSDVLITAGGLTPTAFPYATVMTRESVKMLQQSSYDRALRELQLSLSIKPLVAPQFATTPARQVDLAAVNDIVEQLRARRPDGRVVLDLQPTATTLPGDMLIENNDTLYVPPRPTTVGVFGAVNNPSSFYFDGSGTIGTFLARAGGVQKEGAKSGVFVIRANGSVLGGRGRKVYGERALPGDLIYVPIDSARGETWARIRDVFASLFQGAVTAGAISSAVK